MIPAVNGPTLPHPPLDVRRAVRESVPVAMKLAPIIPTRRQEPFEDPEWGCDLKLDGFRGLADTINGRLLSKNLNPLKRYRQLLDALPLDCVFDGEVCALDQDGRPDFNALLFRRKEPVYIAFDLLFYEREDIRPLPLKERRAILDQVQGNLLYSAMASGASTMEDASLASMSNGSPTAEL